MQSFTQNYENAFLGRKLKFTNKIKTDDKVFIIWNVKSTHINKYKDLFSFAE